MLRTQCVVSVCIKKWDFTSMSSAAAAPPFRKMGTGRDKRTDGIELMTRARIRTLRLKRRWMDARREGGSKEGRKEGRERGREVAPRQKTSFPSDKLDSISFYKCGHVIERFERMI